MRTGLLTIVQPGIGATVQDGGRHGHRHEGVAVSGWLDAPHDSGIDERGESVVHRLLRDGPDLTAGHLGHDIGRTELFVGQFGVSVDVAPQCADACARRC